MKFRLQELCSSVRWHAYCVTAFFFYSVKGESEKAFWWRPGAKKTSARHNYIQWNLQLKVHATSK